MNKECNSRIPLGMCLSVETGMFPATRIPLGMHPDRMQERASLSLISTGRCIPDGMRCLLHVIYFTCLRDVWIASISYNVPVFSSLSFQGKYPEIHF